MWQFDVLFFDIISCTVSITDSATTWHRWYSVKPTWRRWSANEWNQMPNKIVLHCFDRKSNIFICLVSTNSVINPNNMAFVWIGHYMRLSNKCICLENRSINEVLYWSMHIWRAYSCIVWFRWKLFSFERTFFNTFDDFP